MASICAVVLTYNRREMLDRCLTALKAQTRKCDRVLVIDNACTDGTYEMLTEKWSEMVEVRKLPINLGAAGGFSTGMRVGYEMGVDFVWAMDDDVICDPTALEELLEAHDRLTERSIDPPYIVSNARSTSGQLTEVADVDRRPNKLGFPNWGAHLEHGIVAAAGATFCSILLPRATLARYGLPLASMFIFGEDREFTVRITQEGSGYVAGKSTVLHARKLEGALDIRTEQNPVRLGYQYFLHRNTVYTMLKYDRWGKIALFFARELVMLLRLLLSGKFKRAGILTRGVLAGLVYRPVIERVDDRRDKIDPPEPHFIPAVAKAAA